jgi:NADH dehydrogenase FAD-containing subunit
VGFDLDQRQVRLKTGSVLEYDYLIVATGSTHSYFGHEEWAKLAPGLKTVDDALRCAAACCWRSSWRSARCWSTGPIRR